MLSDFSILTVLHSTLAGGAVRHYTIHAHYIALPYPALPWPTLCYTMQHCTVRCELLIAHHVLTRSILCAVSLVLDAASYAVS